MIVCPFLPIQKRLLRDHQYLEFQPVLGLTGISLTIGSPLLQQLGILESSGATGEVPALEAMPGALLQQSHGLGLG